MTQIRLEVDDYTIQVLDVVKGQYGLKNRNEALQTFAKLFGKLFVRENFTEEVLTELDVLVEKHRKKYGTQSMTLKELDEVLGLDKHV